jgi:hypothetical protein
MIVRTELEQELIALLKELIDIEGPLPGTIMWYSKVRAALDKAEAQDDG